MAETTTDLVARRNLDQLTATFSRVRRQLREKFNEIEARLGALEALEKTIIERGLTARHSDSDESLEEESEQTDTANS